MMNAIDIGDIVLFGVLALLAFGYLQSIFSPSPGEAGAMGESLGLIFSFPFAVGAVIIGLVKYRLWRSLLFWMLLVVSALAVFGGSHNNIAVSASDVFVAALFAAVIAILLWQIIMAVVVGVRKRLSP